MSATPGSPDPGSRPERPARPTTVGDYTLLTQIGEGGMGVVHLARKPGGNRVALKMLRPHIVGDHEARSRLAREVSSLRRIKSRWVAEIVDADPWAEVPFVATRYVPGLALHDHVLEEGPLSGPDLTWFAVCLAEGLASVHAVGVMHRDVKPSNVLMEGRTPILIDFGLARVADDPRLTHAGWLLGTPGYLAPEILIGDDATTASDIHSWAATVAYAATGSPPFGRGPSMAIMDRVRRGEHDLSGVPGELRAILGAALAPEPSERPTLEVLLGWLRGGGAPAVADPFTLPLALAAHTSAQTPTAPNQDQPQTWVLPQDTPVDQSWERGWPQPVRVSWSERLRRAALLGAGAVAVAAACTAYPWVASALVLLTVWLLRSGSLAASAAGDRRRVRGRRWYDGGRFLLAAPWHLVRSIPSTLMLVLWSAGLALAAALICYAVAAGIVVTLFASGIVLAVSLWWGPGGSRLRSPISRAVHPLARSTGWWVAGLFGVLGLALLLGLLVEAEGVSWAPGDGRPFSTDRP